MVEETGALGQSVLQIILSLVVATFYWVSGDALAAAWYSRSLSDDGRWGCLPADTAMSGRFKQVNRDTLDQMRDGDRDAWNSVELRLADKDRELRERAGK